MSQKHSSSPFVPSKNTLFTSPLVDKNVPAINISFKNQFTLNLLGTNALSSQKGASLTARDQKHNKFPLSTIATSNYVQGHYTGTQRSVDSSKASDFNQTNKINDLLQSTLTQRDKTNIDLSVSAAITNKSLEKQLEKQKTKPKSMDQYSTCQTLNKSIQLTLAQTSKIKQVSEPNDQQKSKPLSQTNIATILNKINSSKQSIVESKPTIVTSPAQTMNFKKLLDSYMKKPSSAAKSESQQKSTGLEEFRTERGGNFIQIYLFQHDNTMSEFKFSTGTTTQLIQSLLNQLNQPNVIGFTTIDKNIPLDYYLSLNQRDLTPFFGTTIKLAPLITRQERGQLTLKSFHFLQCIGIGGFSRVYLVRSKGTGHFMALKLISKQFIIENQKQSIVQNERDVMCQLTLSKSALRKKFVCQMECAFETKTWVCFGMEYCSGGELFNQLRKVKRMTEEEARPYFIQVCIAVGFLHDHNVLYRDIKPENILIDADGFIKLADFGLARPNMSHDDEAYSFCGSPEYMAPEMLKQQGHTFAVDFYCLGALLYELITGLPPFYSRDTNKIFQSIMNDELQFQKGSVSPEARDLIRRLLAKNPDQRLGTHEGVDGILKHPWIKKLDPFKVLHHQFKPPFESNLKSFNFDPSEFKRGETKFNQEFSKSLTDETENKFTPLFTDFYFIGENLRPKRQQQQSCETDRCITNSGTTNEKIGNIVNVSQRVSKDKNYFNQTNTNIQKRLQQQTTLRQPKQQMRSLITEPNESNLVKILSWIKQKLENINKSQEEIQKEKYLLSQFLKNK